MYSNLSAIVVIFGVALAAAWVMRAVRLPTIIGFLLAGMAVGPDGLNLIRVENIHFFAELGLVMLLFTVGLELTPGPLLRMGSRLLIAAALQLVLTTLIVGCILVYYLQLSWFSALLLGIAVALSSTAIVLKHLSDRSEIASPAGSLTIGVLLFQDVAVIFVLVLLPLLAGPSAGGPWSWAAVKIALALAGLLAVTALARLVVPILVRQVTRFGGRELMTLFAVLMAATGAWLADLAHWSWPLGACIAGLLLAQTDLRHQLHAEIMPFRDVFNALFFMSVGMMADLDLLTRHPVLVASAVLVALLLKIILTTGSVLAGRWPVRLALMAGFGLCTISEFGYVLVAEAHKLNLLPSGALSALTLITVGTMVVGSLFLPLAPRLASVIAKTLQPPRPARAAPVGEPRSAKLRSHVIVVGYGENGQNLGRVLRATGIAYSVIEMNRGNAHQAAREGAPIIVGDAARLTILNSAGLVGARALVVAIGDTWATRRIVAQAHAARPDLYILARTRFVAELDTLYRLGAAQVIPEEFETSIEIFAHVLKEFAVPDNVIDQQVKLIRVGRYGMLRGRPSDRTMRKEWLALLEAAVTQTFLLSEGSMACGKTIREIDLRARTGVTLVAITRGGQPTANPSPDFRLEENDVLVLVGTHKQLDVAKNFLEAAEVPSPGPSSE